MEGGVQDYHLRLEEYCKLHPYFERSVRHFVNMFRYIPYSEVLDTLDFLLHDRFWDIMLKDLKHGLMYNFYTGGEGKSGNYFTHLFVDMIKKELDIKYHSLIHIDQGYIGNMGKNVIVDDASYSGEQMLKHMARFEEGDGDLYIILVAASEEAVHKIRHHRPKQYKINVPISEMFIGSIYPNSFKMDIKDLYLNWDIVYESQGKLHTLLGLMAEQGTSSFYFQHKLPDEISVPELLRGLRNPKKVDRILTREEKEILLPEPKGEYWYKIDKDTLDYQLDLEGFFPLVDNIKPFYKK